MNPPRSVRHRMVRRRTVAATLPIPPIAVSLTLNDASGISHSFLITPGSVQAVSLTGFVTNPHGIDRVDIPVIVNARIA